MAGHTKPQSDKNKISEVANHFTDVQIGTNSLEM